MPRLEVHQCAGTPGDAPAWDNTDSDGPGTREGHRPSLLARGRPQLLVGRDLRHLHGAGDKDRHVTRAQRPPGWAVIDMPGVALEVAERQLWGGSERGAFDDMGDVLFSLFHRWPNAESVFSRYGSCSPSPAAWLVASWKPRPCDERAPAWGWARRADVTDQCPDVHRLSHLVRGRGLSLNPLFPPLDHRHRGHDRGQRSHRGGAHFRVYHLAPGL